MTKITSVLFGIGTTVLVGSLVADASAQTSNAIPDFNMDGGVWRSRGGEFWVPVPGAPEPTGNDPAYPYIHNANARLLGVEPTFRISDLSNPNIKQWAKDIMAKDNEEVRAGKTAYTPGSSCMPYGVPAIWNSAGSFFFLQTPEKVVIFSETDRFARHVYLNVPHTDNPKLSWYGESVGYYEGDTLVIDTIGMNDRTFADNFRTPHTEKLHVIERIRLIEGGEKLEIHVTVEDPDTFVQPWQGIRHYNLIRGDREEARDGYVAEVICQEGNFVAIDYNSPIDLEPDF